MPRVPAPDPISYLVRRRFPVTSPIAARHGHSRAEFPALDVDDAFPGMPDMNATNHLAYALIYGVEQLPEIERYRRELQGKPEAELRQLWEEERGRERAEVAAVLDGIEHRLFYMNVTRPDYDHYCRCATWTLEEALALSFDRDPEKVNTAAVADYAKRGFPFAKSYQKRWIQMQRAKAVQQLYEPVLPSIFLPWAKNLGIELPKELTTSALNSGISLKNWQNLYEASVALRTKMETDYREIVEKWRVALEEARSVNVKLRFEIAEQPSVVPHSADEALSTVTKNNMLRLIAAMGIRGYGYDPREKRNSATSDIEGDMALLGVPMTDETILKYLKEAAALVPAEALESAISTKPKSGKSNPKSG